MHGRRSGVRIVSCFAIAAAIIGLAFLLRDSLSRLWREELVRRATAHAGLTPRLVTSGRPRSMLAMGLSNVPLRRTARAAAAALLDEIDHNGSPESIHQEGIAILISGDAPSAAAHLRLAATRAQHAAWWSDLAAAEIMTGDAENDPERHLAALEASDRALSLDPRLAQAHFNRALVMERLGFERASIPQWQKALELEGSSSWAAVVADHIAELTEKKTARELWLEAQKTIESGRMPGNLDHLIAEHPQEARLWGESWFLPLWGKQHIGSGGGDLYLDVTRRIAHQLASRSGERVLQHAVSAVDAARAGNDRQRLDLLAAGASAYFDGRVAFKTESLETAEGEFKKARAAFTASGSPMAEVADLYLALVAIRLNRNGEARSALYALRRRSADRYVSVAAVAEQYIALIDALDGRWGDALEMASSSRDRFLRLGERQHVAEAELTMADALAFLGQPQRAWRHFVRTAAAFSSAGTWDRLQVCAAAMNYTELRRRRWSSARALSQVELALGTAPELVAHAHLRAAIAAFASNEPALAQSSLRDARTAAASTKMDATRERLRADILAAEARMISSSDPEAAVAMFSDSIAFQRQAGRAFFLPELYLERGRAELRRGAPAAALADFDRGIAVLESQRSRVRPHELRAGLFDDPRDLFAEAVAVSLERGDPQEAFAYLERGRARALIEDLGDVDPPEAAPLAVVQQHLAPGVLMLSYAFLGDRVAVFAVDRDGLKVRFSNVRREVLLNQVREIVALFAAKGDIAEQAANIHDALLFPVRDLLMSATTLIVVPDAELAQLPFAALFDRQTNSYLMQSHETVLAPSAAVFAACARRVDGSPPRSIAVFANPSLPADTQLPSLPAADAEASLIARLYGQRLALRRVEATAARFLREAAGYDVVQFSGHAEIDAAEPWKSSLLFDDRLTARQLAEMDFSRTRLAILNACSTLRPNVDRVEGTSAIAASFLIAGVPTVVGSLWDVDDGDAASLIVRLHHQIVRGVPAATALRTVQREIYQKGGVHPAAWAAFTVLGADGR